MKHINHKKANTVWFHIHDEPTAETENNKLRPEISGEKEVKLFFNEYKSFLFEKKKKVPEKNGGGKEIPLIQGKEQRLCFAGAAVKRYPTPR